ncbi:MAG: DsbA family protein [Pseudomonadales bacterium]|nr:DsbA family protein [Pseudomonadales bacterium]
MNKKTSINPLLCDPALGICEINPKNLPAKIQLSAENKPLRIVYVTDPICSSCWGIEPQLRKLTLEYGPVFEMQYCMGGLLPSWDYFSSGGIRKPSDVAGHWDAASAHYEMPIDGDVWLEDPLSSSYPPSVAVKAAQMQDQEKAILFLRKIREMLFLEKRNITRWEYLLEAANNVGLDASKLEQDSVHAAKGLFEDDLDLSKQLGVKGFPTLFITDRTNNQIVLEGYQSYEQFEHAVLSLYPDAEKIEFDHTIYGLFKRYSTLTTKEYALLTGVNYQTALRHLKEISYQGRVKSQNTKNGDLWIVCP